MPRPRAVRTTDLRGLDLLAPDLPHGGPFGARLARIPVRPPSTVPYRRRRNYSGFVDGFGSGVHTVMCRPTEEWEPIAHFIRHGPDRGSEPGFRYSLEDSLHEPMAVIESARSLSLTSGEPLWRCTTTGGEVIDARPHPAPRRPVRTFSGHVRRVVRRRSAKPAPHEDSWAEVMANGAGGWDLVGSDDEVMVWLTPPGTAHRSSFAVVGPEGASLEKLDSAVLLFAYFLLFGELQRQGGRAIGVEATAY